MSSAFSLTRARVPWALRARDIDSRQRPPPAEEQSPLIFAPKRIEHTEEGAKKPRREVCIIHKYQPNKVLKRTRLVESLEMQLLMQLDRKFEFPLINVRRLLLEPRFQGWTVGRVLKLFEELSKTALKEGFEEFDEMREIRRARHVTHARTAADAQVPLLEAEKDKAPKPQSQEQTIGVKAVSQPHSKEMLRGRLVRWRPYRSEDGGGPIDATEQWTVVVDNDEGQFHLTGVDLKRAIEASGAKKNDTIRIVKRDPEVTKTQTQMKVTEERHGTHGEGKHESTLTRADVYDIYIEKKAQTYGNKP